jgi:signal transduction histidine kinase
MRSFRPSVTSGGHRSARVRPLLLDPSPPRTSIELNVMRLFGAAWLLLVVIEVVFHRPHPGLHGRPLGILIGLIALIVFALSSKPWTHISPSRRIAALVGVTAAAAALAALKPDGSTWQNGPLLVGIIAALWLDRIAAVLMLAISLAVLVTIAVAMGRPGAVFSIVFTAVPWFLVMRLMRELSAQHRALRDSRAAEAEAAAEAERAHLAREMHDVLAHSLSALALQLETSRLLAVKHGVEDEVTRAIDRAHQLAASGLQEARSAIATVRGDELPEPDQIGILAEAFTQQSGLPLDLAVQGQPRPLAPDARLAIYRTAQEALTNIRRHATPEEVTIELSYLPESTVLVVEDRAPLGTPPPQAAAASSGYGLTGMRERAELLGGQLLAQPTGAGFRVELRLPA